MALLVIAVCVCLFAIAPVPHADSLQPEQEHAQPARNIPDYGDDDPFELTQAQFAGCMASGCHPEKKEHDFLHGPMFVNACDACHTMTNSKAHLFELKRSKEQLCVFCHEFDLPETALMHEPFENGSCLPCHSPHGGSQHSLLKTDHYGDLCLSCHDDLMGSRNLNHGPASAGACRACHEPHAAGNRKLLEADGRDLCLRCHVSLEVEIETALVVHNPVLQDCQLCHDPHATDSESLLIDNPSSLCVGCHEDIHQTIDNSTTAHGAILTERSCLNCHSPHASDHPRLLMNDVDTLCFECHNREIELEDGTQIANIKAVIDSGKSLHGPVASGNCVLCHEIHGSENNRLLVRAYSNKLYVPFDESQYALCFGCHDKTLVTEEKSTTATDFRNGDTNLHFVHVNRDKKGRSCGVCHDSHAADSDRHIHDVVPFGPGGWELPIFFKRIEGGGGCASGCHQSIEYNRNDPIFYSQRPEIDGSILDPNEQEDDE